MIQIKESFVQKSLDGEKGYRCGESEWYEPYHGDDKKAYLEVFRKNMVNVFQKSILKFQWEMEHMILKPVDGYLKRKLSIQMQKVSFLFLKFG